MAASMALPPSRRTSTAVWVARGWEVAAAALVTRIGERPGSWKSRMGVKPRNSTTGKPGSAAPYRPAIATNRGGAAGTIPCRDGPATRGRGSRRNASGRLGGEATELAANQLSIGPVGRQQLLRRPVLDDLPFLHHDDAVEMAQGR